MTKQRDASMFVVEGFADALKHNIGIGASSGEFNIDLLRPEYRPPVVHYTERSRIDSLVGNYARRILNDALLGSSSSQITCFGKYESDIMELFCSANNIAFKKQHNKLEGPTVFVLHIKQKDTWQ